MSSWNSKGSDKDVDVLETRDKILRSICHHPTANWALTRAFLPGYPHQTKADFENSEDSWNMREVYEDLEATDKRFEIVRTLNKDVSASVQIFSNARNM